MINIDIPQLTTSSISFYEDSFQCIELVQSSSIHYMNLSHFDAASLETTIKRFSYFFPFSMSEIVSQNVTELIIQEHMYHEKVNSLFQLTNNTSLKQIEIGSDCFNGIRIFELDRLSELESVVISASCFGRSPYWSWNEPMSGECRVVNCPKLKSIWIKCNSFTYYSSFELQNLPSLQSIQLDDACFIMCPQLSLTGLTDWLFMIHRSSSTANSEAWF